MQTALQLAKQGVLAQDSSQQRLNTNLNVVVEAARFCSAAIHSDCSKGEPGPSLSLDKTLPLFSVTYCSTPCHPCSTYIGHEYISEVAHPMNLAL